MAEHIPQPPFLNDFGATVEGPLSPVGGVVYLTKAMLEWSPELYPVILIQAEASATVAVLGLDEETWCPYPGASDTVAAGEIGVFRGRWKAYKVTTAGDIWVRADTEFNAYNSDL